MADARKRKHNPGPRPQREPKKTKSTYTGAANAGLLPGIVNALEGGSSSTAPGASSSSTSTSPSGGKGSAGGDSTGSTNYSDLFAYFGMTPQMIQQINQKMAQYISSGMDETTAYDLIVGAIRGGEIGGNYRDGQSWYQYTYSGISYGVANGLLDSSDPERSYRAYVNTVDNYYQEYFGRNATTAEILQFMQSGTSSDKVNAQLKGQSYANAYANSDSNNMGYSWNAALEAFSPNQGALTGAQKLALGESLTGYSTPLGDQLNKMLATANTRMQTIFKGTLATPADLQKGAQGLNAPSLAGEPTPDVAPI
jgi:hypothetical protein